MHMSVRILCFPLIFLRIKNMARGALRGVYAPRRLLFPLLRVRKQLWVASVCPFRRAGIWVAKETLSAPVRIKKCASGLQSKPTKHMAIKVRTK